MPYKPIQDKFGIYLWVVKVIKLYIFKAFFANSQ